MRMVKRSVVWLAAATALVRAQSGPHFEVAAIRPSPPSAGPRAPMRADPGRVTYNGLSPRILIQLAYKAPQWGIAGGPAWLDSDHYDVNATLPEGSSAERVPEMMQALLVDRFHLAIRREQRRMTGYELRVAKNGPKLKPGDPDEQWNEGTMKGGIFRGRLILHQANMPMLAEFLAGQVGRPVVNRTGLAGIFDVDFKWMPDDPAAESSSASGPSLFTALDEQLGLKLEPARVDVDVLFIDHTEKPSAN